MPAIPKHGASKSRASVRRWSTTRHKSGTGVPTTAQLRITNFVEAHVFHSLQKMTQTEEACGSAQGGHTTPHHTTPVLHLRTRLFMIKV
ncbi:uncharacterized protein LOC123509071 isoform X2 [Portunus trituberculatus]|nr:uncharacterized protein LOC123509071 isoform X2 [Portunus trituberculatus]